MELSEELDRMAHGQQQLHRWQRRTVHRLDAQVQRHARGYVYYDCDYTLSTALLTMVMPP